MKPILKRPNVIVYSEPSERIVEVVWNGSVSIEDCKEALRSVQSNLLADTHLLINRTFLDEFDDEARSWLKGSFMKTEVRTVVPLLATIATVEPKSKIKIFSLAINQLTSVIFPNLHMKSFNTVESAREWISNQRYDASTESFASTQRRLAEDKASTDKAASLMQKLIGLLFK